jgi:hypothetical protein
MMIDIYCQVSSAATREALKKLWEALRRWLVRVWK